MDFHSLSRRELQALCKRNKLPASVTNAAMVDSLKSLHAVEGTNELSLVAPHTNATKTEVFTPARSQRRSIKEDSAVKQVCGTRRSARLAEKSARLLKGVADGNPDSSTKGMFADACHLELNENLKESLGDLDDSVVIEIYVAPQTNRRKTEEALFTPAGSGFTSQRRSVKEDSAVNQICGTRRSSRSAEKSGRLLKGVADGNPDLSRGMFTDDCHLELKLNLKESLDDLDETSVVTDLEDDYDKKHEDEVDLAEEHDITATVELVATTQEENIHQSDTGDEAISYMKENYEDNALKEIVPCVEVVASSVKEVELAPANQETNCNQSGTEAESENSDIPAIDAITIALENSEQKAHAEVVPCEKDVSTESEIAAEFDDAQTCESDIVVKDNSNADAKSVVESEESNHSLDGIASDTVTDENVLAVSHETVLEPYYFTDAPPVEAAADDDLPPPINIKNVLTPIRASAMKGRIAAASDNKENIGSESKTRTNMLVKEISEVAIKLHEMGMLPKNFNEVNLTPKLDKNKSRNEASARTALQVLSDNQSTGG